MTWGVIGSATNATDTTELTLNVLEGVWELEDNLVAGDLQFVSSIGDAPFGNNGDALLEVGGQSIAIQEDGNYTIRLFLDRPDVTFSIARPSSDSRQLFFTDGQSLDIFDISQFQEGFAVIKFQNLTSTGDNGSDLGFPDTCLLYTSPSPRDQRGSRMPSSA